MKSLDLILRSEDLEVRQCFSGRWNLADRCDVRGRTIDGYDVFL